MKKRYTYSELSLLDHDDLIEYIERLEGEQYDLSFNIEKLNIERSKYKSLVDDILSSLNETEKLKEESKRFNLKEPIVDLTRLKLYIEKYLRDNKLFL